MHLALTGKQTKLAVSRHQHNHFTPRFRMTTNATRLQNGAVDVSGQSDAAKGLALARLTIGSMFIWVFFENLGKHLYTPAGYAGLINYYIKSGHAPAIWKMVMGLAASHAAMAAPMQGMTEATLGILLLIGLLTRPAAFVAFLFLGSLWVSEWGTAWIWAQLGHGRISGAEESHIPVVVTSEPRASFGHYSHP